MLFLAWSIGSLCTYYRLTFLLLQIFTCHVLLQLFYGPFPRFFPQHLCKNIKSSSHYLRNEFCTMTKFIKFELTCRALYVFKISWSRHMLSHWCLRKSESRNVLSHVTVSMTSSIFQDFYLYKKDSPLAWLVGCKHSNSAIRLKKINVSRLRSYHRL